AARNKLRILGLTDEDIATFQEKGRINPETTIFAPIAGTVVQRKIGPGQYVNAGASDPVYVIGDLSTVWMTAFGRESDASWIWVAHEDKTIELRQIKPGLTNGDLVEVVGNLKPRERIVTKGSLFIDRAASGS